MEKGAPAQTASLVCTLKDHLDDINWCAFSGSLLATCSADKSLRVYHSGDFSELPFSPLTGHGYGVHCCCFSACGRLLASCSTDATTLLWSMDSGEVEAVLEHPGRSPVRICAVSPDSLHLVSGASDGSLALWDLPSKQLKRAGAVNDTTMVACAFSPCGQTFVTGSTYGDLRLWDLHMKQLHKENNAHDLGVTCCAFHPNILSNDKTVQFRLASCGQDSLLKIWTISIISGACKMLLLHTLTRQSAPVLSCAFSSDGRLLVSGSVDKTVTVYDANKAVLLHTLHQHERYVTACAFSPTSPLIATGSMDKTVNIWRLDEACGGCEESAVAPNDAPAGGRAAAAGRSALLVSDWSEEDVWAWLREDEALAALADTFRANNIDGAELLRLTRETLASELHIESAGLRSKLWRRVEELRSDSFPSGTPGEFLCPITTELMREPVIAADGYSYEREAIAAWIGTGNRSSPMTNLPLTTTLLTPNYTLRMAINRWRSSQ